MLKILKRLIVKKWGAVGMVGAVIAGFLIFSGATVGLRWTNTEKFCISCHEMRNNVYEEYKGTIHDANRTGVRAECHDCHVPEALGPLLLRKVRATGELWGKITNVIDTREKFEEHRYELAVRVWTTMKKNDSLECRNCHTNEGMSERRQTAKAWTLHQEAKTEGLTCIDCHFAIAHEEPEGELSPKDIIVNK